MKINVNLPADWLEGGEEFLTADAIARMAQQAERVGFNAALVTDHPCPTGRWLDAGGHHAQDPFVLLAFIAAATKKLRLQTGILVLPYRNPFITARAVSTLDVLSGGRVSLGVGAGYMKGEYKALGVDFEQRNELMDEYLRALKAAWTQEEFTFKGTGYEALGNRIKPLPVQDPHPPLLIGGNSKRAIRRAVELGDAWNPYFTASSLLASTSRTKEMSGEDDLAEGVAYLKAQCELQGRKTPPPIVLSSFNEGGEAPDALIEKAARMAEMGVAEATATIHGATVQEWCDNAEKFGEAVIRKVVG